MKIQKLAHRLMTKSLRNSKMKTGTIEKAPRLNLLELEDRSVPAGFTAGSIQGQDNWSGGIIPILSSVDQTVDQSGLNARTGIGSWRISNSTVNGNANGNFSGWAYSPGLTVSAGQPSSSAPADLFTARFWFRSASSTADGSNVEIDLGITPGTDRNSFMAITNRADGDGGLQIRMAEPKNSGIPGDFYATQIAVTNISRTAWHRIDITAKFNNGTANDTFSVKLDGVDIINPTVGSPNFNTPNWGTFEIYRDSIGSPYELSNRLLFRSGAAPSAYGAFSNTAAQGLFIDDLSYSAATQAAPTNILASYQAAFEIQPTVVYVDDDWASTLIGSDPDGAGPAQSFGLDSFTTIQGGVNGVATGGTVNVAAGTYAENLLVTKSVTLNGAQAGVDATIAPGARGAESIIAPSSAFGVEIRANGVTVDGFEIIPGNRDAINVRPTNSAPGVSTRSDIVIQNNYIHQVLVPGAQVNGIVFGESSTGPSADNATISGVTITRNVINVTDDNTARGIVLTNQFSTIAFNNFSISNNNIQAKNQGLFASGNTSLYLINGMEILGNTFENSAPAINMGNLDATSKINGNTFNNNTSGASLNFRQAGGEVNNNTFTNHSSTALFFFDAAFFPQSSQSPTTTVNVFTNNLRHVGAPALAIDLDAINTNNTLDGSVRASSLRNIYATVQAAVNAASPGDVVAAQPYTYAENVTVPKNLTLDFQPGATLAPASGNAITVTAGTTTVIGSLLTGVRPTVVQSGATLKGTGSISGPVTVQAGGTHAPGQSPGIQATGDYNLAGTLDIEFVNPAVPPAVAGTDYDQVNVTGTVSLSGSLNLVLSGTFPVPVGTVVKIINNDGTADAVTGTFTGKANASTFSAGGQLFQIFYDGGDGNDVVLLAIAAAPALSTVYVDDDWASLANGVDPDGAGSRIAIGYDSFGTIQKGVNAVAASGTVNVAAGTYGEDVDASKPGVQLLGAGVGQSVIVGQLGGANETVLIGQNGVLDGFSVTRVTGAGKTTSV